MLRKRWADRADLKLHFALSSPHRLMRILGAIISSETLLMRAGQL
jgi:hypothetical protein